MGDNHWIPFTEGKLGIAPNSIAFNSIKQILQSRNLPQNLSPEALAVYNTGLEIFKYYHTGDGGQPLQNSLCGPFYYNKDASFYDIRKFFQGTNTHPIDHPIRPSFADGLMWSSLGLIGMTYFPIAGHFAPSPGAAREVQINDYWHGHHCTDWRRWLN